MKRNNNHKTVMLKESLAGLITVNDGTYVDGTFGRGGHSRAILAMLSESGRVISIDKDPDAEAEVSRIEDDRMTFKRGCFSRLTHFLEEEKTGLIDGVILDLGLSSPQLENPGRGFSFQLNGPLDMRMDNAEGEMVADWLDSARESEIAKVIKNYGEERYAKRVARSIVFNRKLKPIETTFELSEIIKRAVLGPSQNKHPATRTFQALRIYINKELDALELFLPQCLDCLKPGGRLVIISFHSLEDRIVKQFFKAESLKPIIPKEIPLKADEFPLPRLRIVGKPVFPTREEIQINPRSRSAILRIAERMAA